MVLKREYVEQRGIRFSIELDGQEAARAYLYVFQNDLHEEAVGYLEDVFVTEEFRSRGLGTQIVQGVIEEAKRNGCYKLVATSRHSRLNVHELYEQLGFKNWGLEFRLDLPR